LNPILEELVRTGTPQLPDGRAERRLPGTIRQPPKPPAATMTDTRFKARSCPCCACNERTRLLDLPASLFCACNWTYRSDYAAILDISPDARFAIAKCSGCGFIYAEAEPSAAFLAKVYDEVVMHDANKDGSENLASYASRMRYVADLLDLAPSSGSRSAVDYGCGLGTTLRLLQAARVRSVGFDLSGVRVGYASSSSTAKVVGERDALLAHAPFDMIVCDNVLEHLPRPAEAIEFLASVASPGAVLYVSVPDCNDRFLDAQIRACREGAKLDMSLNPWEHLNYFDLPHLDHILGRLGFMPIPESRFSGVVNIGLRRDPGPMRRWKNACATGLRLARYAAMGLAIRSPNRVFYRFEG
jgi:SAM-dependent methyltransferase